MRTLTLMTILTLLLVCSAAVGCSRAAAAPGNETPAPKTAETPAPKAEDPPKAPNAPNAEEKPKSAQDELTELFKPLPADKLPAPVTPSRQFKALLVQIPNRTSVNDFSIEDISGDARIFAQGLIQGLEHRVFHSPQLYFDLAPEAKRTLRAGARLKFADVPARGDAASNKPCAGPEAVCRATGAEVLLMTQWVAGADVRPTQGSLWRYRRGKGVEYARHFDVPALGAPAADSAAATIHTMCEEACVGLLPVAEEAKFPACPRMVQTDDTLRLLDNVLAAASRGDNDGLWTAYQALLKADPDCTRATRTVMLALRSVGTPEATVRALRAGLHAAAKDPTDATTRAYLAHEAWVLLGQRNKPVADWARDVAGQALRIQPANYYAIIWYSDIVHGMFTDEQAKYLSTDGLSHCDDGRIQTWLGTIAYNRRNWEDALRWYKRGHDLMPNDHETVFAQGMLCVHGALDFVKAGKSVEGEKQRTLARDFFNAGTDALHAAILIDPSEMEMVYDFYVRAATHEYTEVPGDETTLRTLFLVQACRNGLNDARDNRDSNGRFNRLCANILADRRVSTRKAVREAKPEDADYELAMLARLNLELVDGNAPGIMTALRELRRLGHRSALYAAGMKRFGAELDK